MSRMRPAPAPGGATPGSSSSTTRPSSLGTTRDSSAGNQSYSTLIVQKNTASGWTPIGNGLGELPQYSHQGLNLSTASAAHLATDGTDVYLALISNRQGNSSATDLSVTLLKKVGN